MHVLIVDDDETTRYVVKRELTRLGLSATEAASAKDAILFLEKNAVDAILSDYRMPGQNGADLLRHAQIACPQTRRVLMSGTLHEDLLRMKADSKCAHCVFEKPMARQAWEPILTLALGIG